MVRRDQDAPGLGHRLDDEDARHDRPSRPVPLEERLVGAHILDRHDRLADLNLEHAVDEQERIAVGENIEDTPDIDCAVFPERNGRGPRAVLLLFFQTLEQPAHQGGVGVMAGPMGDDEPVQIHAQERQVADHVENLVPGAFVGKAERIAHHAIPAEDQHIGRGGPGADAGGAQRLGLGLEQEGPAACELTAKRGRGEIDQVALQADGRIWAVVEVI